MGTLHADWSISSPSATFFWSLRRRPTCPGPRDRDLSFGGAGGRPSLSILLSIIGWKGRAPAGLWSLHRSVLLTLIITPDESRTGSIFMYRPTWQQHIINRIQQNIQCALHTRVQTVHEKTDRTQYPSFRPQFRPTQYPIWFTRRVSPASPTYFSITPLVRSSENAV